MDRWRRHLLTWLQTRVFLFFIRSDMLLAWTGDPIECELLGCPTAANAPFSSIMTTKQFALRVPLWFSSRRIPAKLTLGLAHYQD
jgi:hypothetical protein